MAGRIKRGLEYWGVDAFLAHEDIKPSKEWQEEIIENLRNCHVFMPLLTDHFRDSEWTDQESGMARIESKIIIPLSVDIQPYGFLGGYQAFKLDVGALDQSCEKILFVMRDHRELKTKVHDSFIRSFLGSTSFDEANARSKLLESLGPHSIRRVNEIISGFLVNSQIFDGFTAGPKVRQFFSKNQKAVRQGLRKKFAAKFG